jgi:hypothetical protein
VHDGRWKIVAHGDFLSEKPDAELELYDLESDPAEKANLAAQHPERVTRLYEQLRDFGKLQKSGVGKYDEGRRGFVAPKDWIIRE